MREHKQIKYEIDVKVDPNFPELVNGWAVYIGGGTLHCVTMEGGTVLYLGGKVSQDGLVYMLDPGMLELSDGTYRVSPISKGRGRVFMTDDSHIIGSESVPLQAIKPYIDHVLRLRHGYSRETVFATLERLHGPEIA